MNDNYSKRYVGPILTGASRPHLMESNDNNIYVVKFTNNRFGPRLLANEWICYKLACLIGLPIPKAVKIFVPQELIDIEPTLKAEKIEEGLHFGSLYIKDTIDFTGENLIKAVSNKDIISGIIAFDYWIDNDDRCNNNGNLLIVTSGAHAELLIIDNGNAFTGPHWCREDLSEDVGIIPLDGCVYDKLMPYVDNNLEYWYQKIENLTLEQIKECVCNSPEEWDVQFEDLEYLADILYKRRMDVRNALNSQLFKAIVISK